MELTSIRVMEGQGIKQRIEEMGELLELRARGILSSGSYRSNKKFIE